MFGNNTEVIKSSRNESWSPLNFKVSSNSTQDVDEFNYLDIIITKYGQIKNDIKTKQAHAKNIFLPEIFSFIKYWIKSEEEILHVNVWSIAGECSE